VYCASWKRDCSVSLAVGTGVDCRQLLALKLYGAICGMSLDRHNHAWTLCEMTSKRQLMSLEDQVPRV
jgi:hypothetical protein